MATKKSFFLCLPIKKLANVMDNQQFAVSPLSNIFLIFSVCFLNIFTELFINPVMLFNVDSVDSIG